MNIKTTYDIGQLLYVYTHKGLTQLPVISINVRMDKKEIYEMYQFEEYGD